MNLPRSCCCFKTRRISNEWNSLLMLISHVIWNWGIYSYRRVIRPAMGLFTAFAFIYNMGLFLKVFPIFLNGADHEVKNAIRPLIPSDICHNYLFLLSYLKTTFRLEKMSSILKPQDSSIKKIRISKLTQRTMHDDFEFIMHLDNSKMNKEQAMEMFSFMP